VVIDALPAHPIITVAVAVGATGRTKPALAKAIEQLAGAGVLVPLSEMRRNRSWEARGYSICWRISRAAARAS
jgi:hypothetical protein